MDLRAYMKLAKIRQLDLARVLGCAQSTISQIISGKRRPSPELALRIEEATGGAVRAAELVFGKAAEKDAA